jgi:23S rRNA (cytosine1962-C5)-methyltransferase
VDLFRGVERVLDNPALGDTVDVVSAEGERLARAAYSPHTQIRGPGVDLFAIGNG